MLAIDRHNPNYMLTTINKQVKLVCSPIIFQIQRYCHFEAIFGTAADHLFELPMSVHAQWGWAISVMCAGA